MTKLAGFLLFFIIAIPSVFTLGRREANTPQPQQPVAAESKNTARLIGRIQIYGNTPHTFAGIIDKNGIEYAIYPPELEEKLRPLQGHVIEFTVVILDEPRGVGSLFLRGGTVMPLEWNIIR